MNAVNDVMVDRYLADKAGFYDVSDEIQRALDGFCAVDIRCVDDVVALDEEIRVKTALRLGQK